MTTLRANNHRPLAGLLAGILLPGLLAGCLDFASPPAGIEAPPLERLTAEYRLKDGTLYRVTLEPATPILDRDGAHRLAYPLIFTSPKDPDQQFTYHVDASLRLVRSDITCQKIEGVCQYYSVDWSPQGDLPPWGIGILWHLSRARTIPYSSWDQPNSTTPKVQFLKGEILVSLVEGDLSGSYVFRPGELFPLRFARSGETDSPEEWERVSYEGRGPLGSADDWPKAVGPPTPGTRTDAMFPGQDHDDFGSGHPHGEALDWLLSASSEAKSALDRGGCLVHFRVMPEQYPPPPTDPLKRESTGFVVDIVGPDGKNKAWSFTRSDSILGSSYSDPEGGLPEDSKATCEQFNRSPWPAISSTEFFVSASGIPVNHTGRPDFSWDRVPSSQFHPPPETGWDGYAMQYRPAFVPPQVGVVSYMPYTLAFNANHGWWYHMNVHPDDIRRMDGS